MQLFDFFLLLILLYGVIRGFMSGLVVQITTFVGFLLGIYIAFHFSELFTNKLTDTYGIQQTSYLPLISFSCLFILTMVGMFFLGKFIKILLKISLLSPLDRVGGAVLGTLKFVLIIGIALQFLKNSEPNLNLLSQETIEKSILYQPIVKTSAVLTPLLTKGTTFIKDEMDREEVPEKK